MDKLAILAVLFLFACSILGPMILIFGIGWKEKFIGLGMIALVFGLFLHGKS